MAEGMSATTATTRARRVDGGYRPPSSQISYGGNRSSGASTPNYGMDYGNVLPAGQRSREPYPAWTSDAQIPLSKEEVEDIFLDLAAKFGFQRDSMRNMYDHLMTLLDSRASRMTPNQALLSLHADYIGGDNANYRKWYFAAHLDLDDAVGVRQHEGQGSPPVPEEQEGGCPERGLRFSRTWRATTLSKLPSSAGRRA